ncbi:MAG: secretion protein HlyD family protein [Gemmatimonadetes bacterium]|nr:secretion protein HlyD family protein [Gemmatimonadota bacterium]
MKRIPRIAAYAVVLALALGTVFLLTRGKDTPTAMAATKTSGAATPAPTLGSPVSLTPSEAKRIGVTYATATVGGFGREVRTVGQVSFDETRVRTIALKVDGFVDRLIVNATGQPVAAGQSMLTIYSPMLVTAQEELLLARRLRNDVADASSETRRSADEMVSSSRRRLAYWDIPLAEINEIERSGQVQKTVTLRALSGGYVLEKNVTAGQKVMAGEALYKVADLSVLWVEGEVFEQDMSTVLLGASVQAEFAALPGEHRMGRISYIYPTLNPETRTVRVRVVFSNRDLALKPGMYATLRIAGRARANVLTVPRSAVLSTGERSLVFVREANGQLTPREVSLGTTNDDRVEVLRGLTAGETVVASATFLVDAESNLGKALGGMGNMPGMEVTTPPKALPTTPGRKE